MPPWSHVTVLSWAGMRGVVSLAAALALPAEFPQRDIILFLAFCAILATLVLQGTTLGPLIQRLGVSEPEDEPANPAVTPEAIEARSAATVAAMEAVAEKLDDSDPEQADVAEDLLRDLRVRAKRASGTGPRMPVLGPSEAWPIVVQPVVISAGCCSVDPQGSAAKPQPQPQGLVGEHS